MTMRAFMLILLLAACLVTGCSSHSYPFLGIPENESSGTGPVGLIDGKPCQVKNVDIVLETTYEEYLSAKQRGRILVEETHGGWIYYAIKEYRDVVFDNASAWVEFIERYKTRIP